MQLYANLLALVALQSNVWEAAAFSVQMPAERKSVALFSSFDAPDPSRRLLGDRFGGEDGALRDQFDKASSIRIEGQTLRTCALPESSNKVQVILKTTGRPLQATADIWQGPDYTPVEVKIYLEDGSLRPFNAIFETPGSDNAIAIRNTGQVEFPLDACIKPEDSKVTSFVSNVQDLAEKKSFGERRVQGGAVKTFKLEPEVNSVQIMLESDTYADKLCATIELLQGPNNKKQQIDIYGSDGKKRPFYAILDTPGTGNVVRIINTATVEFPLIAVVEPYTKGKVSNFGDMEGSSSGGMTWK